MSQSCFKKKISQCRNVDFETKIASRNVATSQCRNRGFRKRLRICRNVAISQRYYSGRCRPMLKMAKRWIKDGIQYVPTLKQYDFRLF